MMTSIASLMANKIKSIEADQRLRKQKAELDNISKQLVETQLLALRSQMNPHFIFNALNSIKKFVLSNEVEDADKYLGKFSKLIRWILSTSQNPNISIQKEIDMLSLYLELEKMRFGKKLNYHIDVDESLIEGNNFIPTMIVQPFVENSILHGIMHKESPGEILIAFKDHDDHIEINVSDNGVGRKKAAEVTAAKKKEHISFGIEIIKKRLQSLKRDGEDPSGIEIYDLAEGEKAKGTLIKIFVPK
jgi:sensor histidine kinase YesM